MCAPNTMGLVFEHYLKRFHKCRKKTKQQQNKQLPQNNCQLSIQIYLDKTKICYIVYIFNCSIKKNLRKQILKVFSLLHNVYTCVQIRDWFAKNLSLMSIFQRSVKKDLSYYLLLYSHILFQVEGT